MTQSRIPTRDSCNQDDPRTAFKWAFVDWPFTAKQGFTPPSDLAEDWSQRLWDLGFRHDPDAQVKKLIPPHRGQQHPLNNTSRWVGMDEPEPDPVVIPDVSSAVRTRHEQEVIKEQLEYDGVIPRQVPQVDKASLAPTFQPADHAPGEVRGYLIGADDRERRRVLALEMTGKKRQQILNDPRWKGL